MPERDKIFTVVAEWVEKADHDLTAAFHTLKLGEECPTDIVCFHAQQCVEKYFKAILVLHQIPFPKIHDIAQIASLFPSRFHVPLSGEQMDLLTQYAAASRYPGWRQISLVEARGAVTLARRARKEVRKLLPRTALRRRK
jgi:HEPN domain-containing protein